MNDASPNRTADGAAVTDAAVVAEIRAVFQDAGVSGWLHARPVTGDGPHWAQREVAVGADSPVVMASVYKVFVLMTWCRAVDAGELDPRGQVTVAAHTRTPGTTGISALADPVTMSRRDLVRSMITVSDNAAADVVHAQVGPERVAALPAQLGLVGTRIIGGTSEVVANLLADTGTDDVAAAFSVLADNNVPVRIRALNPAFGSSTTAADTTRFLAMLWRGELASPSSSAFAREVLGAQVWPHRLRSGFPAAATVAAKTGTIGAVRNDVGIISYPEEHPVAVAVYTHAARSDATVPRADAAIGAAARVAVNALRAPAL